MNLCQGIRSLFSKIFFFSKSLGSQCIKYPHFIQARTVFVESIAEKICSHFSSAACSLLSVSRVIF